MLGVPLSAQAILSFSATLVSMSFIGHIGKHELSAAVLGTSLFNVTGLSILIGLCSAMETLSGQVTRMTPAAGASMSVRLFGCSSVYLSHIRSVSNAHQFDVLVQNFGAKNYGSLGIILQRALLVTAAASILIIAFWTNMSKLLILLGTQPPLQLAKFLICTDEWPYFKDCSHLANCSMQDKMLPSVSWQPGTFRC